MTALNSCVFFPITNLPFSLYPAKRLGHYWFLIHFLPTLSTKNYRNCDEVVKDLRKYLPGYEKSKAYFKKTNLYQYLTSNGDLQKAIRYADQLYEIAQKTPEDSHSYTQIHKVLIQLDSLEQDEKQ